MVTRRQFITRGVTFVGASLVAPRLAFSNRSIVQAKTAIPANRILLVVELEGGNDGLNTVIPYTQSRYRSYRPGLALSEGQYLEITDDLALHGRMTALKDLYDAGRVAVVQGVGYPNPDRSHFRSTEIWQTAEPNSVIQTGWLGRYLDLASTSDDGHIEAIAVTAFTPAALGAADATVAAIPSLGEYQLQSDGWYPNDQANRTRAFLGLHDDVRGDEAVLDFIGGVSLAAYDSSVVFLESAGNYQPAVAYPDDPYGFGANLETIAQMIDAEVGTNVFYTGFGSFDTHAQQAGQHAALLGALSDGLSAFYQDMVAHGRGDDVLVMTFSEFGRRVDQNSSEGTDHGAAAPLFVLGNSVKGGIYGDHPSLTELGDGDLIHTVDFRSVYSSVLRTWLEADPRTVLGGDYEELGFLNAPAARKAPQRAKNVPRTVQPVELPRSMADLERMLGDTFRPAVPNAVVPLK
jgi:uncharacterized protein (DUF1501 family)